MFHSKYFTNPSSFTFKGTHVLRNVAEMKSQVRTGLVVWDFELCLLLQSQRQIGKTCQSELVHEKGQILTTYGPDKIFN